MSRTHVFTPEMPSLGPAVAAIGVFDGVHVGHAALVHDAIAIARAQGTQSVVVTFDRDPDQVVSPAGAASQLLEIDDKLALLAGLGPDMVLVVPFDSTIASMPPLVFLDKVLMKALQPKTLVVGYDFRFGHRAEGDVDVLVRYGSVNDCTVVAHDLVSVDGEPVTSTRIRRLISTGDVRAAARLLGRPHRLAGSVVHGKGVGRSLGAPTANIMVGPFAALPSPGVYAAMATVGKDSYPAGVTVGASPTFTGDDPDLEAHLIGFEGDLYGQRVLIEFVDRLRDQRFFEFPDDLVDAIKSDLIEVRRIVGREG